MERLWHEVLLARHGQTEWNAQERRQGLLDSPLTQLGLTQAFQCATVLTDRGIDRIFSSPLGRCLTTATIVGEHLRVPVTVVDELAEIDHGTFSGLTHQEIEEGHPGELARRERNKYRWAFPAGESYADADLRAAQALADPRLVKSRSPLIVSHEMIGRMLQRHLLCLDTTQALASAHPHDVIYVLRPGPRTRERLAIAAP